MSEFSVRILENDEVWKAQRLLYDVYVAEQGWEIASNNPSGLRVESSPHGVLLRDKFDAISTWIGVFRKTSLVGVHRFLPPLHGHFELELYHKVPDFLLQANSVECNRLAVAKDFRAGSSVVVMLLVHEFEKLRDKKIDYAFGASPFPSPGDIYLKLGLKEANVPPFKYNDTEQNSVRLVYFDFSDPSSLERFTRLSERLVDRSKAVKK